MSPSTTTPGYRGGRRDRERGVALLTALLLMLAILMTSIAAARSALSGSRAAGHERDRLLALHAAMAALADAEHDIEGGQDPASARAAALASGAAEAFTVACQGGAPYDGLCAHALDAGDIYAALADESGPAVTLGSVTGARIPAGEGALAAQAPRYLIERMPSAAGTLLYRITALGFGSAPTTQAAVQAYYRKLLATGAPQETDAEPGGESGQQETPGTAPGNGPAAGEGSDPGTGTGQQAPSGTPGSPGGPGVRVGWREIGNWHDTVAAAGAGGAAGGGP